MKYSTTIFLTLLSSALADPCADACTAAHNKCVTAPDSNKSTCAANYATCLGYNPYETEAYVEPTACRVKTTSAPAPPPPTQTSQAPVRPPVTPLPSPEQCQCAKECTVKKDACLTAPGSNKSTCAANYASCLGYNPYATQPYVEPTACAASVVTRPSATQTNPPTPIGTGNPGGDNACIAKCKATKNNCLTTPGSNKSTCVSDYEGCKSSCPGTTPISPPIIGAGDNMRPAMLLVALGVIALL